MELISNILFLKMQLKLATIKIGGVLICKENDTEDCKHSNGK